MIVPFLDVGASYRELRAEMNAAFERVMESGWYILGRELEEFEDDFARSCGTSFAVGVGNGFDALALALRAMGVKPGDEIIVPAHTFIATWLSVVSCGAKVVPVDVNATDMLINPAHLEAATSPRTAGVVPVHLYGNPVPPSPITEFAAVRGLLVIGDAAQAHGAAIDGQDVGAIGDAAAFSFYPSKNLAAFGDGGAVTTDDEVLAQRIRRLRNYGSQSKYEFAEQGVNSRLDPLQAAFLRVKLRVLDEWNARRARIAARYLADLKGLPELSLPPPPLPNVQHSWQAFCIRHPRRDALQEHLATRLVETQVHYSVPPHLSPAFAELNLPPGSFPVTEHISSSALSLPIGPHMDMNAVDKVIEAVHEFAF